jgi:hypothetical protein
MRADYDLVPRDALRGEDGDGAKRRKEHGRDAETRSAEDLGQIGTPSDAREVLNCGGFPGKELLIRGREARAAR